MCISLQEFNEIIFTATLLVRIQRQHSKNVVNGLARVLARLASPKVDTCFVADLELLGRVAESGRVVALQQPTLELVIHQHIHAVDFKMATWHHFLCISFTCVVAKMEHLEHSFDLT